MEKQDIFITTPFIRLDSLLKLSGIAETGGHAKILIQEGELLLNGEKVTQRGRKIRPGDVVAREGLELHIQEKV